MELSGQDCFIRLTGQGKSIVNCHRVWNIDAFLASQIEAYSGPKTKPEDRREVSLATKADYVRFNKKG